MTTPPEETTKSEFIAFDDEAHKKFDEFVYYGGYGFHEADEEHQGVPFSRMTEDTHEPNPDVLYHRYFAKSDIYVLTNSLEMMHKYIQDNPQLVNDVLTAEQMEYYKPMKRTVFLYGVSDYLAVELDAEGPHEKPYRHLLQLATPHVSMVRDEFSDEAVREIAQRQYTELQFMLDDVTGASHELVNQPFDNLKVDQRSISHSVDPDNWSPIISTTTIEYRLSPNSEDPEFVIVVQERALN